MGGFASKGAVLEKAVGEVLLRSKVSERALKSRAESLQIVREAIEAERPNPAEINALLVRLVDERQLVQALLLSLQDLRVLEDEDYVLDNVLLNVQVMALLGKFVESQETMDRLGVPATLGEKVLPRYTFDEVLAREIKLAVEAITGTKEAESGKLTAMYTVRMGQLRKKADAVGVLDMMHQGAKLPEVQKLGVKALYSMIDKKDNKQKLSEFSRLQRLLSLLRAHEDDALVSFTGLVMLTDMAAELSDGDLSDLGKNHGCAFAVKQLLLHQEQNADLCQQAFWFINELCRTDANVRVMHGVGGMRGIDAAMKRYPRTKDEGGEVSGIVVPQRVTRAIKRMKELEEEFGGLLGFRKSADGPRGE